jgi:hypothetical protein
MGVGRDDPILPCPNVYALLAETMGHVDAIKLRTASKEHDRRMEWAYIWSCSPLHGRTRTVDAKEMRSTRTYSIAIPVAKHRGLPQTAWSSVTGVFIETFFLTTVEYFNSRWRPVYGGLVGIALNSDDTVHCNSVELPWK